MIELALSRSVSVIGAGMTRFHHKVQAEKQSREMFAEAALDAASSVDNGFRMKDVQSLFLGCFSTDMSEKQAHTAS